MPRSSGLRRGPTTLAALCAAFALTAPGAGAADAACDVTGAPRVVAIGDVHGAYENFVAVLRLAGLVDEKTRWSGGKTHLVQTGDVVDRGADSRKALDLLMRLEGEARKAGGRVHALLGNHEVMNLLGDLRYVSAEDYASFRTPRSEELRESLLRLLIAENQKQAREKDAAFDEAGFRERFLKETPLGYVERSQAFGAQGEYGRWLRKRPAVVRIDGVLFLHGGISPGVAPLGCAAINETVRGEVSDRIAELRAAPASSLAAREDGPLWYRGLASEDESAFAPSLDEILKAMGARAIVVGHTVTRNGRIGTRFGGRVVTIDAGMLPAFGGHLAALEISPRGMSVLYSDGREALSAEAAR
jgi:hypothetical protein